MLPVLGLLAATVTGSAGPTHDAHNSAIAPVPSNKDRRLAVHATADGFIIAGRTDTDESAKQPVTYRIPVGGFVVFDGLAGPDTATHRPLSERTAR